MNSNESSSLDTLKFGDGQVDGGGDLVAWPQLDRGSLIHWIAERRRERVTRQAA